MTEQALWIQQFGRASRGRLVHAKRARKLRQRGEVVRYVGRGPNGLAQYRWFRRPAFIDYKAGLDGSVNSSVEFN